MKTSRVVVEASAASLGSGGCIDGSCGEDSPCTCEPLLWRFPLHQRLFLPRSHGYHHHDLVGDCGLMVEVIAIATFVAVCSADNVWSCGNHHVECSLASSGCLCQLDIEGGARCIKISFAAIPELEYAPRRPTGMGFACEFGGCCGRSQAICSPTSDCTNPASVARLFRRSNRQARHFYQRDGETNQWNTGST